MSLFFFFFFLDINLLSFLQDFLQEDGEVVGVSPHEFLQTPAVHALAS